MSAYEAEVNKKSLLTKHSELTRSAGESLISDMLCDHEGNDIDPNQAQSFYFHLKKDSLPFCQNSSMSVLIIQTVFAISDYQLTGQCLVGRQVYSKPT